MAEFDRESLPKAPDGTFEFLAALTEEHDLAINDKHFRFFGGVGREWVCKETGGQCTGFSVGERLKGGVYRHMGAHITDNNRIASIGSSIETVTKEGVTSEVIDPPDVEEILQVFKRLLEPPKRSTRSVFYKIPNKPNHT